MTSTSTALQTTLVHPASSDGPWWRDAVVYQVYPRSFADSDGDGMGDLPGITAHLPHLAALGVDAVWISPFYPSPQHDAGYDVADYCDIEPTFGTLDDADALLAEAKRLGLRVLVDLVPNHTSWDHAWFRAALAAGPGSPERARYIFRDGKGPDGGQPPNNWLSTFGGTAWTRVTEPDGTPGQWYLHLFDDSQPDLDWTNPEVHAEFAAILRFWLDRGVDGFRIDVAHGMIKADGLPDTVGVHENLDPTHHLGPMWDQEGVHEIYREWRRILDSYQGDRAMVAEAWVADPRRMARYVRPDEVHQSFNFGFLTALWDATVQRTAITDSLTAMDEVGATTTWVLSNHDVVRHASRLGLEVPGTFGPGIGADDPQPDHAAGLRRARAASLMMLALPGSAYVYQGEELGLPEHTTLDDDERQDPVWERTGHTQKGRDGCRVPLPWSADAPAYGFSPSGASWLTQPEVFRDLAADRQVGVPGSTFEMYRGALALRRDLGLGSGSLAWADDLCDDTTVAFVNRDVLVVTNLASTPIAVPPGLEVLASSADERAEDQVPAEATVWFRVAAEA